MRHLTEHTQVSLRPDRKFGISCTKTETAQSILTKVDMTTIPGDRQVWFAFNEDRFRRQGHTGKWWGKLIRTWKTGTDGEMTKACFRLSDGQDVTLVLEEEEYMDTPEQHEGYCDPENVPVQR